MEDGAKNGLPDLARNLLEHRDSLFAYVLSLVRDWTVAEDLFQEVSLVVLRKDREGTPVGCFGPWAREIARRTVLNYWKTTSRSRLILSEEVLDAVDAVFERHEAEEAARRGEDLGVLRRCLDRLPTHLRRIVDMRYRESLPLGEIARRLGRSAGSVQVALSRTRARLLECARRLQAEAEFP